MALRQFTLEEIGDESNSQDRPPTDSNSHCPPKKAHEGEKYYRLTVIERHLTVKGTNFFRFKCDCGNETIQMLYQVKRGIKKSCGCYSRELKTTHGKSKTKLYEKWCSMKSRCNFKKGKSYKDYGGRGIKVCEEWEKDFVAFYNWAKTNGYEDGLQIDRIDNNRGYSPDNCRWVTQEANAKNHRNAIFININGTEYRFKELAGISGIKEHTLRLRHRLGWKGKDMLKPVDEKRRKKHDLEKPI